jgi:hypothetical protein
VRVFGLLFVLVAGPVLAAEAGDGPALARLAYAKSPAFLTTLEEPPAPAAMDAAAHHQPDRWLPAFVAADKLAGEAQSPVQLAAREVAEAASVEPKWPARVGTHMAEEQALTPATEPEAAGEGVMSERLAALPGPMHLIPDEATGETAAEPQVSEPETVSRPRIAKKRKTARKPQERTKTVAKNTTGPKPNTVPRWAEKMFDPIWQRRAFEYQ